MKDLKRFEELKKTLPMEKWEDWFTKEEYNIYTYDSYLKLIESKFDNEKRYLGINDLQGAMLGVGCNYTAKEWCEKALDLCDMDEHMVFFNHLVLDCNEEQLISAICDFWEIEIVESTQERIMQLEKEGCEIVNEYI